MERRWKKGLKSISGHSFSVIPLLPQYLPRELKDLLNQISCLLSSVLHSLILEMQQGQDSENPMLCVELIINTCKMKGRDVLHFLSTLGYKFREDRTTLVLSPSLAPEATTVNIFE